MARMISATSQISAILARPAAQNLRKTWHAGVRISHIWRFKICVNRWRRFSTACIIDRVMKTEIALFLTVPFLTLMALPASGADFNFDSAGVKIHYLVEGKGPPVILIHGLLVSARLNWGFPGIIDELATNHQVIAMDCRGHGLSDAPTDPEQYGVKMVDDVVRLMDHLNLTNADIVGYSMGGMIAMKLMTLHPERVRTAVIGGMGWVRDGKTLIPGIRETSVKNATAACIMGFKDLAITAQEVKNIKTPFVVVVGDNDPGRPLFVAPLHLLRPDVPIKIVEGANHISCVTKPQFKEDIRAYLERPTPQPPRN
jgi:pimeloyl-ACP methyl ester carboxylesterase